MATVVPPRFLEAGGTYTFSSQPRAVMHNRKKYRVTSQTPCLTSHSNEPSRVNFGNIMHDRRVVRGNTYSQQGHANESAAPEPPEQMKREEARRRALARRRAVGRPKGRIRSPPPVEGRQHSEMQTEVYLEELSDRVQESDVSCQTDPFLDRPLSPTFVPAKTGVDAETQILPGELFDFDREVQPILEVLVGKTMEQSVLEVMEEEELASLRQQQRQFHERRNAELAEQQRLAEQERRLKEEKERRVLQQQKALQEQKEAEEKVAAAAFAQSYLADLVPKTFSTLEQNGFLYDPVERDIELTLMPQLLEDVVADLQRERTTRYVLDEMIKDAVSSRAAEYEASQNPTHIQDCFTDESSQ